MTGKGGKGEDKGKGKEPSDDTGMHRRSETELTVWEWQEDADEGAERGSAREHCVSIGENSFYSHPHGVGGIGCIVSAGLQKGHAQFSPCHS